MTTQVTPGQGVPNPLPQSPQQRSYTELRIHTLLLARIATLLSIIAGPAAYTVGGWTPEDLTADIDNWRNDPDFQR